MHLHEEGRKLFGGTSLLLAYGRYHQYTKSIALAAPLVYKTKYTANAHNPGYVYSKYILILIGISLSWHHHLSHHRKDRP